MMKKLSLATLFSITLIATSFSSVSATSDVQGSPKIINPYLDWQLRDEDLSRLARWDAVILDADQQARNPERVRKLRKLNPAIKIFAYVPSEEIANARFAEPVDFPFGKLASQIRDEWYVHDASGQKNYFWAGSALLNVTDKGPIPSGGVRWNEFLPQFIHDNILSTGLWDGIFLDNTFDAISYYAKSPVDLDRDGVADTKVDSDRAWREGMIKMIASIRRLNPDALLIGNGGHVYADSLNGAFFEHFPSYNWAINWQEFRTSVAKNKAPSMTALNVNTNNQDRRDDYRLMRYGLANALVGGGYYSFDKGDYNHNTLWWYDEYETPLGAPRAEPRALVGGSGTSIVPAVWSRDFQNGIAILNSSDATKRVPLPGVFEKLRGTQDPVVNDGTLVRSIDLASKDGIVLLRKSEPEEIRGSAFDNGTFVRIYDSRGRQPQSAFFAQRADVPSGVRLLTADLDQDKTEDLVTSQKGIFSVRTGGTTRQLYPFGKTYKGNMSIAVGNLNKDTALELVVGRDGASPPEVKILSRAGTVLATWNAYRVSFAGGVRVAVGDLDGDGFREIVTGAGPGGGPHIRLWKTDGGLWGGGFFAFDESERGGVDIAAGDVDGDGKDEIIVASGQGAIPRLRIFDGKGTLKQEIALGTKALANGLRVAVADVNGDGLKEILVSGLPIL